MNNFNMNDSRNRRNLLNWSGFFPFQSVTNYSTNSTKMKIDMKNSFGDALYINNLHLIPDPLKKNLADSIITGEVKTKTNMASETQFETKLKENNSADHQADSYPPLGIITSFISGVFSFVSGAMFHKRTNSPTQYYECYEKNSDESVPSLQAWQHAKPEDQNKNGRAHNIILSTNESSKTTDGLNINSNTKTTLHCDDKINQVCLLLSNHSPSQYQSRQTSCQQNVFIESNSIEDCFEDAFTPEEFESLPDVSYLEFYGPFSHATPESIVSDAPKIRTEYMPLSEQMEIVNTLPDIKANIESNVSASNKDDLDESIGKKAQIVVSSCEDKMNKLKSLLQKCQKNNNNTDNNLTNTEEPLKHTKLKSEPVFIPNTINLNSTVENVAKEKTSKESISPRELYSENIVKDINDELQTSFTDSQCSNTTSEYLDPCNYFDEVTGRFYSTSADSEDSFQIVFDDSPKTCRGRMSSECESEDSFIIFDDTPDSCYSSNDVFGDELNVTGYDFIESSDSETSVDSDSDSESDSGCDTYNFTCKLSHSLTRTIGDLTDDSLYNMDKDEVDCAARFVEEKSIEGVSDPLDVGNTYETETKPKGLLLDNKRKLEKKRQPTKTVRFSPNPPKVHVMRVWAFAARQARAGHWERHALDRERFKRRIADVDMAVSWVLKPQHRARVMFQRFMPWWNAQRRKELAEKKQREEDEKTAEVKEISNELPDVRLNSESSVNNTDIGNNVPYQTVENQQNTDSNNKSHIHEVKIENLTTKNGKILPDDVKINGLKYGFQNNDVDVST